MLEEDGCAGAVERQAGKDGGEHVVVGLDAPWAVNANAGDVAMATKVVLELGSIEASVAYAQKMGGIPPRKDVAGDPDFQKMSALAAIHAHADEGTYLRKAPGFSAVAEGVGRATEALLRKTTDVAGAQKILVDYVRQVLGDDKVE